MLHDDGSGPLKFPGKRQRRFQVHQIVVRKFLALQLPCGSKTRRSRSGGRVQRGPLVRILAVAQLLPAREGEVEPLRQNGALREFDGFVACRKAFKLRGNFAVIARSHGKCFTSQFQPRLQGNFAMLRNFSGDGGIVRRIGHYRDAFEILRG